MSNPPLAEPEVLPTALCGRAARRSNGLTRWRQSGYATPLQPRPGKPQVSTKWLKRLRVRCTAFSPLRDRASLTCSTSTAWRSTLLFCTWLTLYVPYLFSGGFVRDDLGFLPASRGAIKYMGWLDEPRGFANYADFQAFVSSFPTMTGRPVAALLTGLSYWFIGATPWPYHLLNLTLLGTSIILVFGAIRTLASPEIALLTALLALAYPSASATAFSFIMINSNLAAVLWASALYIEATRTGKNSKWKDISVVILLLCSALSYESFIPLFLSQVIVRYVKRGQAGRGHWLRDVLPALVALVLFGTYRSIGEKIVFPNAQATVSVSDIQTLTYRLVRAEILGLRESFARSVEISFHSLGNLGLLPAWYLPFATISLIAVGGATYACVRSAHGVANSHGSGMFVIAAGLYLISNSIFVLSVYVPNSSGFESRTQGAIRFAVALVIAVGAKLVHDRLTRRRLRQMVAVGTAGLLVFFAGSIVGQREAWVEAAHYNAGLLRDMDAAIQRARLNEQAGFTFVADLPATFPRQVNAEPLFGEAWDLGPALSLVYPDSNIRANVYEPIGTTVGSDSVVLHGYWEARYPFYFYRFGDGTIYSIKTAGDFGKFVRW